jgi:hypothetical protein
VREYLFWGNEPEARARSHLDWKRWRKKKRKKKNSVYTPYNKPPQKNKRETAEAYTAKCAVNINGRLTRSSGQIFFFKWGKGCASTHTMYISRRALPSIQAVCNGTNSEQDLVVMDVSMHYCISLNATRLVDNKPLLDCVHSGGLGL